MGTDGKARARLDVENGARDGGGGVCAHVHVHLHVQSSADSEIEGKTSW